MFSRTTDQQNHVRQATMYVTDKTLCRQTSHRHFKQVKIPKEIHDYVYHLSKCRVMPRIIRYTRYLYPQAWRLPTSPLYKAYQLWSGLYLKRVTSSAFLSSESALLT
jgi:hypothetical protein